MESRVERNFERLQEVIAKHQGQVSHLIPILQEVQEEYRYLPEEVLTYIATAMKISPSAVYGVATFYSQFSLLPKGKYVIRVCDGTACHVRGSEPVRFALEKKVGLKAGQITTADMQFTVETVACLGACGFAPVVTVNDHLVYGQMTPESVNIIIDKIREMENDTDGNGGKCHA